MWYTRLLLLAAIVVLVGVVGNSYYHRRQNQERNSPPEPTKLAADTRSRSEAWTYEKREGDRTIFEAKARNFRQPKDSNYLELEGAEFHINRENNEYDRITCEKAVYNTSNGMLMSDGEVEIARGIPKSGPPKQKLLVIKAVSVRYESKSGKVETDKAASFTFGQGSGKAVGAVYDPGTRELFMKSQVELFWKGKGAGKDMTVQAGELRYKEQESKVYLAPWSKLVRGTLTLNAADSVVTLKDDAIDIVDAQKAQGGDVQPQRKIDYAADQLHMQFSDEGEVKRIEGNNNARLVSTASGGVTTMSGNRVEMDFDTATGASVLQKALSSGNAQVEAKPVIRPDVPAPDTKVLHSEVVEVAMRPGGQEIDRVLTHAPGNIEFLPNRAGQKRRRMDGERLTIQYGPENQIQSFRSVNVSTRTESEPKKGQPAPPALTWSKDLIAEFDGKSGTLTKLDQWNDFRYEEGPRKAKANHATLDQASEVITLTDGARVWDDTGSTTGDKILLLQKTNETRAEGNVISVRQPDQTPKKNEASLLAADQPLQAKANRMVTAENNQRIRYEGNAILWQGVNRLQADQVDINRKDGTVLAAGNVITQFVENRKDEPAAKKAAGAPAFTLIRAPQMAYNDKDRVAHYQGGVSLTRPGLDVKSQELRAFLKKEDEGDSSLDHAFADGKVEILQRSPDRTRQGYGEHAEYYLDDEKIFLEGGQPQLIDSLRGKTTGRTLTYYSGDDRLLVDGAPDKPALSNIKRKPKKK